MREIRSLPIRLSGTGSSGPAAPLIDVLSKGKVILANELINRDGNGFLALIECGTEGRRVGVVISLKTA